MTDLRDAFLSMRFGLGLADDPDAFDSLVARYGEPHRHYHTLAHIDACVCMFDRLTSFARNPAEVLAALLYHDAVYDPLRSDNEAKSAELARIDLTRAGANPVVVERVADYVLATRTHDGVDGDAALVVDIDDAILGAEASVFDAYEDAIAAEFSVVPRAVFLAGRRAFLESLLTRERLFLTDPMHERFDARARANVRRSIERLARENTQST